VGVAYTTSCIASGGVPPYSFGLNPLNVIPAGLTAVQSGANVATISGTPIQAGNYSFGIFVQDSATPRHSATTTFTGTVAPAGGPVTLRCNPGTGPATVGVAYTTSCIASGGVPPYSFGLNPPNVIPAGLTLVQSYYPNEATISGTPTQAGNYSFGIFVQDSANPRQIVTTTFTGTIAAASLPNYIRLAGQVPDPSLGCKDSAANCISMYLPTQGLGHVKIQH
jgi:hypothetical protein